MVEHDAQTLADQAILIGLLSREQVRQARADAEDGTARGLTRALTRKGWLTSWQSEKLAKGELSGFFYGQFKVLFHIAEGTFARVYRGVHRESGQPVAIKVLRRRFTTDAASVARFAQEAEAGMRLIHPNIVRIYEYGEAERNHYMVMEYVEGSNLRDFLKIRGRLGADESLPILLGLAHGMKYSHDMQVTHRDIKGTNILISTRREAKLVDFGLATVGDDRSAEFAHTRTVDYSALERTCGSPKGDPRSDLYFLGCVFYQMLTGVLPLPEVETADPLAKMLKRSFGAIKPIAEMRYAPPAGLCAIIERMMQIKLERRYQSMTEVVRDLDAYNEQRTGHSSTAPAAAGPLSDEDIFEQAFGRSRRQQADDEAEAPARTILCVEAQDTVRDAFKKAFAKMNFRVLMVGDSEHAAQRYREAATPPDVVVFDADGQDDEVLDHFTRMHEKAHEDGHDLAAVVILGTKQKDLADELPLDDRLIVLHKPIKLKEVQDALGQLLAVES